MKLLEILHRPARALYRARNLFLWLALLSFVCGLYAALTSRDLHAWSMRVALVLAIWSLLLYACIQLFHRIPAPVLPALRWRERWRESLRRGFYQLLAGVMILMTLILLQMSLKLLTV